MEEYRWLTLSRRKRDGREAGLAAAANVSFRLAVGALRDEHLHTLAVPSVSRPHKRRPAHLRRRKRQRRRSVIAGAANGCGGGKLGVARKCSEMAL